MKEHAQDPESRGKDTLYLPEMEHDACGIGMIAHLRGAASHQVVDDALSMLANMEHRGACGCDPDSGDGAGILIQIPHRFLQDACAAEGIALPAPGAYAVGMVFFPRNERLRAACRSLLRERAERQGFELLGFRPLPVCSEWAGETARSKEPLMEQVFLRPLEALGEEALERKLFFLRRSASHYINRTVQGVGEDFYFASLSARTLVYKGQFRTFQLRPYFPDLGDPRVESALAIVHARFSTNTFPKWRLAQPFRYLAHNGEINTIRGNINWMRAKEGVMESDIFTREELEQLFPICDPRHSDSRNLDSVAELLTISGRSLPHVMRMLIPEAWQDNELMDPDLAAFYEYHSILMEPWDGPASICFTDGRRVGAVLDRNGLRPSRYQITTDDRLIIASEVGPLRLPQDQIREKGKLRPGHMLVADLQEGRLYYDHEIKAQLAAQRPYRQWLREHKLNLERLPLPAHAPEYAPWSDTPIRRLQLFGVSNEECRLVLAPMLLNGEEAIGSMGADTPLAALSDQPQHISHYFRQFFAQVSNPPIDPIREKSVMSLRTWIGGSKNLFDETPEQCRHIAIQGPVLTNEDMARIRHIQEEGYKSRTLDAVAGLHEGLEHALDRICREAEAAIRSGANILIISDRKAGPARAPIPMLMAVGAVHHFLIEKNLRFHTALLAETGDAREVHHFATLVGYGAVAVNPYLVFDSFATLRGFFPELGGLSDAKLSQNYVKAIEKGLLKVLSKMGISTLESYHGAQIFEILGLGEAVVGKCFRGSISRIGGLGFEELEQEVWMRHHGAWPAQGKAPERLDAGGLYQWKQNGEAHLFSPKTVHLLQRSARSGDYEIYQAYAREIDQQSEKAITLRSLLDFIPGRPVPLEEVEPVEGILRRFATGAMSFGSISHEAHSTLAIAMNRIGGKSNCGEGGEDPMRYPPLPNGDSMRSAIKQVASGRFGVTAYYLSEADEIQIKIAQGAKPGEGGQLPGHKVDEWIGRVRYATPGVGLISPPPHHDIYSIEDLAQLIYDLKCANRFARISVKLVSEAGVGTIAAGVAKAHADHILISGHDGGTGASPLSSIRHAGLPWEMGLAETHQTLMLNNLRSRVTLQADGQIRTGRDIAIATLLGAEEWGVATAALVAAGCIMMRKCHLNTCPVGVATQDPRLRALFSASPDDVVSFFTFLAQDFRAHMARLGFRRVEEMVGRNDRLRMREGIRHWKHKTLNLSRLLASPEVPDSYGHCKTVEQEHGIEGALDWQVLEQVQESIRSGQPVSQSFAITNVNRAVGTILSHEITRAHQEKGLPEDTIRLIFKGSAGQSFGAFGAPGLRLELEGEANDYVGKGLSGAKIIVYPDKSALFEPRKNVVIGNVAFYGATSGEAYIRGFAGERFCVRNSGAQVVVEGIGDHGCEYMTGGRVVVLGKTGRNFAAGMSGGIAYIYDPARQFPPLCNRDLADIEALDVEDRAWLQQVISRHYAYTGSRSALGIMTDWGGELAHFVKVLPREYKAALERQRAALQQPSLLHKSPSLFLRGGTEARSLTERT